jgi:DAACS family dicarboxylate/amino acid:cation (Na+ or H+) symporter
MAKPQEPTGGGPYDGGPMNGGANAAPIAPLAKDTLHLKILAGLALGAGAGGASHFFLGASHPALHWIITQLAEPLGQIFLRLMLLLVIPLVASSLILAITGLGDLRKIGRMGLRSFGLALAFSTASVLIGVTLANVLRPGQRMDPDTAARMQSAYAQEAEKRTAAAPTLETAKAPLATLVQGFVPTNVFHSLAKDPPDMLGLMAVSLFLGVLLLLIPAATAAPVIAVAEGINAAVTKGIHLALRLAPYAVFCLLFAMTARFGFGLLPSLGWFVGAVLLGLVLQATVVYSLALIAWARISPWVFYRRIQGVAATAFSTSSSNATLPTTLRVSEEGLGIPAPVGNFVLTIGATANQNGTALFEGVTVLFLAQLAGVDLSLSQQLMVVYLAVLGGIGTAGVPSGSIPFVIAVLGTVGVNPALIAVVLGVDRLLDMCRTVVNVTGDMAMAACVAKSQGWVPAPELALGRSAQGRSPARNGT